MRKCWAVSLGNCSGKMSNEHVFSAGVFSGVPLHGTGGSTPHSTEVSVANLKAKTLCTRHNSGLSELDNEASKLAKALLAHSASTKPGETSVRVDGWKIERWCMKVGCNMLASRWVEPRDFTPNTRMVRVIFGLERLASDAGLSVVFESLVWRRTGDYVACQLIGHAANESAIQAAYIQLHTLGFIVSTHRGDITQMVRAAKPPDKGEDIDLTGARLSHRPQTPIRLAFRRDGWERDAGLMIEFMW
jgi:hypothetical protein